MSGTDRENRERDSAERWVNHDRRERQREQGDFPSCFAAFAADLTRTHAAVLTAPQIALRPYTPDELEALASMPFVPPSPEDINRMAAADEERLTEARRHRPFLANPHD
jgi:hypothetical protein